MIDSRFPLARRTLIKGAGAATVAGAVGAMPVQAEADAIWSSEYWARKGDVPLWMFRKRLGAPKAARLRVPSCSLSTAPR